MHTLIIMLAGMLWFFIGYKWYGTRIERTLVKPDDTHPTAAVECNDNLDYAPARPMFLWGHHFSSIAGAGPIIGPIMALAYFGWGPTLLWITLGCVFMGAVHDYLSLMVSVRHQGKGIAEIAGLSIGKRTRIVFAILLWITLVFIIAVFASSGAQALADKPQLIIPTSGVCIIAVGLGFAVYKLNVNSTIAAIIAVILAYALVWVGMRVPISMPTDPAGHQLAITIIITVLFVYCIVASLLPVWLLLQPRDFISSIMLFVGLALGIVGLLLIHPVMDAPIARGGFIVDGRPIWPMLFIIVACGAISGFHTMVATGTTSKQLDKESHGKLVGYGAMIMEGVLAFLVVMLMSTGLKWGHAPAGASLDVAETYFQTALSKSWIIAFGSAFGRIVEQLHIPELGYAAAALLGALMVKTFIMTSLDTSTRLGRYIFTETIVGNIPFLKNHIISTLFLLVPAYLLAITKSYATIWKMFGASNQLIAAITLVVITAYLAGRKQPKLYTLIPAIFMLMTTIGALLWASFNPKSGYLIPGHLHPTLGTIAMVLVVLTAIVCHDGFRTIRMKKRID